MEGAVGDETVGGRGGVEDGRARGGGGEDGGVGIADAWA